MRNETRFNTVHEVAERLGEPVSVIETMIRTEEIQIIDTGIGVLIDETEVTQRLARSPLDRWFDHLLWKWVAYLNMDPGTYAHSRRRDYLIAYTWSRCAWMEVAAVELPRGLVSVSFINKMACLLAKATIMDPGFDPAYFTQAVLKRAYESGVWNPPKMLVRLMSEAREAFSGEDAA